MPAVWPILAVIEVFNKKNDTIRNMYLLHSLNMLRSYGHSVYVCLLKETDRKCLKCSILVSKLAYFLCNQQKNIISSFLQHICMKYVSRT